MLGVECVACELIVGHSHEVLHDRLPVSELSCVLIEGAKGAVRHLLHPHFLVKFTIKKDPVNEGDLTVEGD